MVYRALLIGNSNFAADAGLNPLNAPTKDVARLHRALVDAESGLFDDRHVRLVTERTWAELVDELDRFFASGQKDDLLLLYYSGHGLLDERNRLFLCARDTRSDRLLSTAVSNTRINEFIDQSAARCIVIVLDCCSSGMFKGGDAGQLLAGPGRYIISSTRGSALANDAATPTGTSLFTEHLVIGLLGAADDINGDGYVDLREIYEYVKVKLTSTSKQVPHCRFDGDASVTLARRRPPVLAKAALPPSKQHPREPVFALSENVITLRDIDPDERLQPEIVEIYPLLDTDIDCIAETEADWLRVQVRGQHLILQLAPREGPNRAKVMVRDRMSGAAQVLRLEAHVRRRSTLPTKAPDPDLSGPHDRPREHAAGPPAASPSRPPAGPGYEASPPPLAANGETQQQAPQGAHAISPALYQAPTDRPSPTLPSPDGPPSSPPADPLTFAPQLPAGQPPVQPPPSRSKDRSALAPLVIAIAALVLSPIVIGGALAIVALVLTKASRGTNTQGPPTAGRKIKAARILAWIALALSTFILIGILSDSVSG
jgi:hypothetical protein